jgi:hypothetical protein
MDTRRRHVINMQELYNPATFLDSTCFSELYHSEPSHDSSDNPNSYYQLRMSTRKPLQTEPSHDSSENSYYHFRMSTQAQRKTKPTASKRHVRAPIVAGMQARPIPSLGCSTQQRFLAEAIPPSVVLSVEPLLLQAGQIPGKRAGHTTIAHVLAKELNNNATTASDSFIDRLFPKDRAPFTIDGKSNGPIFKALAKAGFWNLKTQVFENMAYTESGMGDWLNKIGATMQEASGCSLRRRIRSFSEVTSEIRMPKRMEHTINAKSYLSFMLQFDRRFATALSFCSSGKYSFTLTDREGQIYYDSSLRSPGLEAGQRFLTILAFLMFGDDSDIGLDPHFIHDDDDRLVAINIDNKRYELRDRIYAVESLLGRGTNVWIVTSEDNEFILKDSGVLGDLVESEIVHLQAMIEHSEIKSRVSTFVDGGDVKIKGTIDSTANYRGEGLVGFHHNQRVHRRIVTGPVGTPLTRFRSKKEFVRALMDVVSGKCHRINIAILFSSCP